MSPSSFSWSGSGSAARPARPAAPLNQSSLAGKTWTIHDKVSQMHSRSSGALVLGGPTWTQPNDALTEVLRDLRLVQSFYCHSELSAPWALALPPEDHAVFHFVASGEAWLERAGHDPLHLAAGDFVLFAPGVAHVVASAVGVPGRNVHELPYETVGGKAMLLRHGGDGARTVLGCGGVRFEDPSAHPLVGLMPDVLHIRASQGGQASL